MTMRGGLTLDVPNCSNKHTQLLQLLDQLIAISINTAEVSINMHGPLLPAVDYYIPVLSASPLCLLSN